MKLIWQDILIILALIFELTAHFATLYLTTDISAYSHVNVTTAVTAVESNPFQRNLITAYYIDFAIQFILYGLLLGMYLEIRKKALISGEYLLMNVMVLTLFVFTLGDATNDLAYLAAFIFKV